MSKITVMIIGLALIFSSLTGSAALADQGEMIKAMVELDRVFIPCLALTNKQKVGPSTKAIAKFKSMWSEFSAKYAKAMPNDGEWISDIDMVTEASESAFKAISQDKDCEGAHHALEEVRFAVLQMRTRNKIPYYLDYLNNYHEAMEPLVHDVKAPADWTDDDIKQMGEAADKAHQAWQTAASAQFDTEAWGFKPAKVEKLKQVYANGNQNFEALGKALASGDKKTAMAALKQVKPIYSQTFKLFGDFKQFMK